MQLYDEKGFPTPIDRYYYATDEEMQWWKDAKFGMFVHWGPAAICGGDISWCRVGPRPEDHKFVNDPPTPAEEYDNLYKQFNPTEFNADEWIETVKQAGMKYFVIITKHHDGFCMFDSRFTDHKVTAPDCPCQRDIIRELSDACHKKGIKFGIYYSGRDWYHPDYLQGDNAKYLEYYTSQLVELLTGYGRIDLLWFDHIGGKHDLWNPDMILRLARTLHPGIIINDRLHASVFHGRLPGYDGDFSSPEQNIGTFDNKRAWESCLCLVGGVWSYKPNGDMMSYKDCVRALVSCAGGDGNLLLNNGPMPDGRIEPRQKERLLEVGRWLGKYGESIYGTRGGPVLPCAGYACTCKGTTYYIHVLADGDHEIEGIPGNVSEVKLMSGVGDVKYENGKLIVKNAQIGGDYDMIVKITSDTAAY